MLKLIKYEFLRKYKLIAITVVSAAALNLFLMTRGAAGSASFLMLFPMVLAVMYVSDVIRMYSDDLNKKSGYMLFMTPNSGYKIIVSKLAAAVLEGLGILLLYFVFILINGAVMVYQTRRFIDFSEIMEDINILLSGNIGINLGHIFIFLFAALVFVIGFIVTVYTAMTIRKSIFSEIRFGGLLSFIIFIALNWALTYSSEKIYSLVSPYYGSSMNAAGISPSELAVMVFPVIAVSIIQSIALTIGSGYLLEKKINL
ncbi:MAG: hypothetical protein AAGU76_16440 [Sedimentibacter sp.]|uniref:hypothetical protein n=1 Tax=Sedimentibacter sp. TaxID=1960295 RepID=UPI0031587208